MILNKKYEGSKIICEYNSSNLKKSTYDINEKKLTILFGSGTSYEYEGVPHEVFSELNLAESQGKYFNVNIAKKYNYKKI